MPSTFVGLLLFVVFLTPGFVYLSRLESRRPGGDPSALREAAQIVTASLCSLVVVLTIFSGIRALLPGFTLDAGALARDPRSYIASHYVEALVWGVIIVGAASAFSAIAAVPPAWLRSVVRHLNHRTLLAMTEVRSRPELVGESGWSRAFFAHPDRSVVVGIAIDDGSYLRGNLFSFNPQILEDDERSIVLSGPVHLRSSGATILEEIQDVGSVVIAARDIRRIDVYYVKTD